MSKTINSDSDDRHIARYLESYKNLPGGCEIYQIARSGNIWHAGNGKIQRISKDNEAFGDMLHLFISKGNQALYLLGSPKTDPSHPTNATAKFGIMDKHAHFEPHAHGVQHFVLSTGYTACKLFDKKAKKVVTVELQPLSMIDIKPHVPHAFMNRDKNQPNVILVANAGLGLENSEYAVTEEQALKRLETLGNSSEGKKMKALVAALRSLKEDLAKGIPTMSTQEKIGSFLAAIGERISMGKTTSPEAHNDINDKDLIKYVTGQATPLEKRRIEKLAAENHDIAHLIAFARSVLPAGDESPAKKKPWQKRTENRGDRRRDE